ncbi:hypothetical protein [Risungbinella massiliensis]|uniref:hypothetical protein n=1 Tax=Risungbinella massiliensis TaxID=1329796 RepID=UPI0005CBB583|nr:hypothetical protein [Risungbinella massiliensis]
MMNVNLVLQSNEEKLIYNYFNKKFPSKNYEELNKLIQFIMNKAYKIYKNKKEYDQALHKLNWLNDIEYHLPFEALAEFTEDRKRSTKNKMKLYRKRYAGALPDGRFIILDVLESKIEKILNDLIEELAPDYECPLCSSSYFNDDCPACGMTLY